MKEKWTFSGQYRFLPLLALNPLAITDKLGEWRTHRHGSLWRALHQRTEAASTPGHRRQRASLVSPVQRLALMRSH